MKSRKKGFAIYQESKVIERYSMIGIETRLKGPFSVFFCNFARQRYPHMKNNTPDEIRKDYQTPSFRFIDINMETSFLQSNLEPIGGGDDPDIDW